MAKESWWNLFNIFSYAFAPDPLTIKRRKEPRGAAFTNPEAIEPRQGTDAVGTGSIRLRQTHDLVDISTVTNRLHRYKEYERLRNMPEIETAMTVFADEACVSGETKVATPHGFREIAELTNETDRFLVYCYDEEKKDYTLGWAHSARKIGYKQTKKIYLDDGSSLICTPDHRILMRDGTWKEAQNIQEGDLLMPFYRIPAQQNLTKIKTQQFPRIYSHQKGWIHERQFLDDWTNGTTTPLMEEVNKYCRMVCAGVTIRKIEKLTDSSIPTILTRMERAGFSNEELKWLGKKKDHRKVMACYNWDTGIIVYDLTVEKYNNFATDWGVVHNCQKNDDGKVMTIHVKNQIVKEELEYLLFHRKSLNMDQKNIWNIAKQLFIFGDFFWEILINPDNPKEGIKNLTPLPPETMYRIESTKGKLIEFQQSKEGPDYESLSKIDITQATEQDLLQAKAIRFPPEQIIHIRVGDDRKTFYPYGVSLMEAARGPAHQLRLMEDSAMVYRLSRAPERRVFYIDVQQIPPYKAMALVERMKDQLRKKKVPSRSGLPGASGAEERWHAPAMDEDFWIPIRPNANTRVETLPGACLALDTEIPLLDGRTLQLKDIIKEFTEGKQLWTYSCCPKTGKSAPGLISWAGVTRKNTEVVKITFENGKHVVCTPDHKFPVQGRDGKIQAKDLNPGDSMFPFETRMETIRKNSKSLYRQVYDTSTRNWLFVHRMAMESTRGTKFSEELVFSEEYRNCYRNVVHHKNYDHLDNSLENLVWMNWDDHILLHRSNQHITNENISRSLKAFHENMSEEDKFIRDKKLAERGLVGNKETLEKLADPIFNSEFRKKQVEGWVKAKQDRPELHKNRGKKISERNDAFWANPNNKKKVFDKQTIVYPNDLFDAFVECIESTLSLDVTIDLLNANKELLDAFCAANQHLVREINLKQGLTKNLVKKMLKAYGYGKLKDLRRELGIEKQTKSKMDMGRKRILFPKPIMDMFMKLLNEGYDTNSIIQYIDSNAYLKKLRPGIFNRTAMEKMLKDFGYDGVKHVKREKTSYNHKVVSVEYLPNKMDTGTLTIDQDHIIHDYHTFAINDICYTCNSSLGEIDDVLYFKLKLFTALHFPKNYMNNEDPQSTRVSLSTQNAEFARLIERLQSYMEDAFWEICHRHLQLLGFPEETYDDLMIKFTPPSDWRELSRAEVVTNRLNNAANLKGSQLMSDYDILINWLKYPEDEAKKMLARLKLQKLEDLKLQIIAQNPTYIGVGLPGPSEQEIGTDVGGPNPSLSPEIPQPGMMPPSPEVSQPGMSSPKGMIKYMNGDEETNQLNGSPLPDPTEEDIKKYNLEIKNFEKEMDYEEIDDSERE